MAPPRAVDVDGNAMAQRFCTLPTKIAANIRKSLDKEHAAENASCIARSADS